MRLYRARLLIPGFISSACWVLQDVSSQETNVVRLLEWGADPNLVYGPTKMTPLHMAASWHRTALVAALLTHGADAGKPDVNGLTPLHCAVV
jgi:ankyrin repeat protein